MANEMNDLELVILKKQLLTNIYKDTPRDVIIVILWTKLSESGIDIKNNINCLFEMLKDIVVDIFPCGTYIDATFFIQQTYTISSLINGYFNVVLNRKCSNLCFLRTIISSHVEMMDLELLPINYEDLISTADTMFMKEIVS